MVDHKNEIVKRPYDAMSIKRYDKKSSSVVDHGFSFI
jgi:hypothetical protein